MSAQRICRVQLRGLRTPVVRPMVAPQARPRPPIRRSSAELSTALLHGEGCRVPTAATGMGTGLVPAPTSLRSTLEPLCHCVHHRGSNRSPSFGGKRRVLVPPLIVGTKVSTVVPEGAEPSFSLDVAPKLTPILRLRLRMRGREGKSIRGGDTERRFQCRFAP